MNIDFDEAEQETVICALKSYIATLQFLTGWGVFTFHGELILCNNLLSKIEDGKNDRPICQWRNAFEA